MLKTVLLFCLCVLSSAALMSQSALVAGGGDIYSEQGVSSYSLGQLITSYTYDDYTFSDGVQHAYELWLTTGKIVVIEHYSGEMLICANPNDEWASFQWYHNGLPVSTDNYCFEEGGLTGNYYVEVMDHNGNYFTSIYYSYSQSAFSRATLILYPNPVTLESTCNILYQRSYSEMQSDEEEYVMMSIQDISGKVIYTTKLKVDYNQKFDFSSRLGKGVYFLIINDIVEKLIID